MKSSRKDMVSNIEESIKWLIKTLSPEEKKPLLKTRRRVGAGGAWRNAQIEPGADYIVAKAFRLLLTHTELAFMLMKKLVVGSLEDKAMKNLSA